MSAIDNHLSAALSIIQSANAKIKVSAGNTQSNNSGFTSGIKDTYERSQNEYSYNETHRMEEHSNNPFNRDNWNQTGVSYEEKNWNDTDYRVERNNEPKPPEKSWIDEHTDAKVKVWDTEIDALNHEGSVYGDSWQNDHHKLEVDALGYETTGEASLSVGRDGVTAEASASAEAYVFKGEYEATYGPGYTKAAAFAGAEANVSAEVNFNPMEGDANVSVGGEAFAGGKAEVATGAEGQYGKAEVNAGVTYGLGVEAKADVGIEDGKVKAEIDLGATVGLGFDVGFEVEIDAKETAKDLTGWIPWTPW